MRFPAKTKNKTLKSPPQKPNPNPPNKTKHYEPQNSGRFYLNYTHTHKRNRKGTVIVLLMLLASMIYPLLGGTCQ